MDDNFDSTFEDFKNRQILELCIQCVNKMQLSIDGKVSEMSEMFQSLVFLKMEIGGMIKKNGHSSEDIQSIIRRIFSIKDMIENTQETSGSVLEFLPWVEGLLMFLY